MTLILQVAAGSAASLIHEPTDRDSLPVPARRINGGTAYCNEVRARKGSVDRRPTERECDPSYGFWQQERSERKQRRTAPAVCSIFFSRLPPNSLGTATLHARPFITGTIHPDRDASAR